MSRTHLVSQIAVTSVFLLLYAAFLVETGALLAEFGAGGVGLRLAFLDSQNFIFFPVAGLLALVAFWRPAVLLVDAFGRGKLRHGRLILTACLFVCGLAAWGLASLFSGSHARSVFEISPAALMADKGTAATGAALPREPVLDVLARMKILSSGEGGLPAYRAQCDPEWLQYATAASDRALCFPAGQSLTVGDCCRVKTAFREHLNTLATQSPSRLAAIHRYVLPVKCFFLLLLLGIGILLVRFRKGLERVYGGDFSHMSFGLAVGGAVMLVWPLLNASYLETMSLLTGGGASSAYTVMAPLVALGFGVWTLLLVFFHLRAYPSQIEYAAKIGGFIAAAIGVFRYEDITMYLSRTLGVGGSIVAIIVFAVAVIALLLSIVLGIDPTDIDFDEDDTRQAVKPAGDDKTGAA